MGYSIRVYHRHRRGRMTVASRTVPRRFRQAADGSLVGICRTIPTGQSSSARTSDSFSIVGPGIFRSGGHIALAPNHAVLIPAACAPRISAAGLSPTKRQAPGDTANPIGGPDEQRTLGLAHPFLFRNQDRIDHAMQTECVDASGLKGRFAVCPNADFATVGAQRRQGFPHARECEREPAETISIVRQQKVRRCGIATKLGKDRGIDNGFADMPTRSERQKPVTPSFKADVADDLCKSVVLTLQKRAKRIRPVEQRLVEIEQNGGDHEGTLHSGGTMDWRPTA
ncbi:MAG: hypothetical protein SGJ07_02285 [Rhodospirillaceae bacterium]|nr:hypothetical protein [Rhodospirillaceae bacterium]